jgi:hypothetical protein
VRIFGQNANDTVGRLQEDRYSDIPTGEAVSTMSKTTGTTEGKETDASRRK